MERQKVDQEPKTLKEHASETIHSRNVMRATHSNIRRTNYFESFVHLIKGNIGAGIFALGEAYKNAGLLFGFNGTLLLGLICTYNMHVIVSIAVAYTEVLLKVASSIYLRDILKLEYLPNFPDTVELSVLYGPKRTRKLHKLVRILVKIFILSTQLGFCSIYVLFVASTAKAVILSHAPSMPEDLRIYILIVAVPMLCTALIPSLKFLTPVSLIANLLLLTGLFLSVYLCAVHGFPSVKDRPAIAHYSTWSLFFGTAIFAFEGIALVIPLRNEMKNPNLFQVSYGVLNTGMAVVVLGTASMGFIAYLAFGEEIKSTVTLNFTKGIMAEVVKICVAAGIMFSYAIQFHVAVDVTWWDLLAKRTAVKNALLWELLYRTGLSLFTILVAATVPFLGLILSLIGSMFSTALALFFPAICDIALRTCPVEEGGRPSSKVVKGFRLFMDALTLFTACIGWVTGTGMSLFNLYEAFRGKGYN